MIPSKDDPAYKEWCEEKLVGEVEEDDDGILDEWAEYLRLMDEAERDYYDDEAY